MKHENYFEIIIGSFVLICAAFFFFSSFSSAKIKNTNGYNLFAKFDDIGGIEAGSDIKIAGVKIGNVDDNFLDLENYRAVLKLTIKNNIKLPIDSSIKIVSSGLIGEKYIEIIPGGDIDFLKNNDEILYTQSSVNFEQLLSKFMFNSKEKTNQ